MNALWSLTYWLTLAGGFAGGFAFHAFLWPSIAAAIAKVDTGSGVIVLTDLFGGTPSNLAISLMDVGRVEVIAGINLPMLIRLESARRRMKVVEAVAAAREAGRKYISVASEVLGEQAA